LRNVTKAFLVATVGTTAMAGTAQAATVAISPVKPCYLTRDVVTVSGAGFTAGGAVNFAVDGQTIPGSLTADAAGNVSSPFTFGRMDAVKQHTLTGTDATNPALTGSVAYTGTTFQIASKTSRGKPGKKSKLRGYGFIAGPKAYMHVRGHGIARDTFLARPAAPCGTFTARKAFVPSGAPVGKYKVRFDHKKKYSKQTKPQLKYTLTVFRTFNATAFGPAFDINVVVE
jgi:hypothetical protein